MKKLYMVVTNDAYELPVAINLTGARAVGKYLNISENAVRMMIYRGRKTGKYKVIVSGRVVHHAATYAKRCSMTHDRSAYFRAYYRGKTV